VRTANDTLSALALVNRRIAEARGAAGQPNALLDERDRLLADLNAVIKANATVAQDGTLTVTSQRGEPLVIGSSASRLVLTGDALDPSKLSVSVLRTSGETLPLLPSEVGGSLAGLMRFATEDIDVARGQLGRMTAAIAGTLNQRQSVGLDATGQAGAPLLQLGAPVASAANTNTGSAGFAIQITDPTALKPSDYALSWDGSQYSLERLSDGTTQTFATLPQTIDGLDLSQTGGSPAAGDRFLLRTASAFANGTRALQTDPARIATALPVTAQRGATNSGDVRAAELDVQTIGPATGAPVTITFTGPNTFDVSGPGTGNPSGITYTPGMTLSFNGWTMKIGRAHV
jgi:flagellar hook-associated protein 1 FlgK